MAERILALDLGTESFKLLTAEKQSGQWTVTQVCSKEIPAGADAAVRQQVLKELIREIPLKQFRTIVSVLDDSFSCMRQVHTPPMPAAELMAAVRWEMQNFLAIPLEETAVDLVSLGEVELGGVKKQRHIVAAVPVAAVRDHCALLASVGIHPTQLIPKNLALAFCAEKLQPASADLPRVVLEIGSAAAECIVLEGRWPVFARKIPGGGSGLTKEMTGMIVSEQGQVALTADEAEQLKRGVGIPAPGAGDLGVKGISGIQLLSLMRSWLDRLAVETERSVAFYGETAGQNTISEIILLGGGAHLRGLPQWLSDRLGIRVTVPVGFSDERMAGNELAYAAVLGAVYGEGAGLNLLPAEIRQKTKRTIQRISLIVIATLVSVGVILGAIGLRLHKQTVLYQVSGLITEDTALQHQWADMGVSLSAQSRIESEPRWRQFLMELSQNTPPQISLQTLLVDEARQITLHGTVHAGPQTVEDVVAEYLQALSKTSLSQVELRRTHRNENGSDLAEFDVGGRLSS